MAMWYYWITVYTDWLDDTFNIMPTAEIYLFIVSTTWIISIALTVYLGIRHFIKVRRIKKQKKSYEEL